MMLFVSGAKALEANIKMSDMSWPSQLIFKTNPPLSPGWIKALWSHCEPLRDTPALSQVLLPFWLPSTHKVCLQHMCHIPWSVHILLQKNMQRDWSGKKNVLFSSGLRSHVSTHKWLNPNKRKAQANCQEIRKCTERLKTASEPDKCSLLRSTGLGSFSFWGQNSLFQVLRREYKQWLSTAADHPGQEFRSINIIKSCLDNVWIEWIEWIAWLFQLWYQHVCLTLTRLKHWLQAAEPSWQIAHLQMPLRQCIVVNDHRRSQVQWQVTASTKPFTRPSCHPRQTSLQNARNLRALF